MPSPAPQFSARFVRATEAERNRLAARLVAAKARARAEKGRLAAAEAEVSELEARLEALAALPGAPAPGPPDPAPFPSPASGLRGAAIREVAVEVLVRRGPDAGPIHYRRWLAEVVSVAGPVAGKRPEAVFLGQVSRHPLVRATTKRGFYELDLGATERLEARVAELRDSLATATTQECGGPPLARRGRRSRDLALELGRAERALGEALEAAPIGAGEGAR